MGDPQAAHAARPALQRTHIDAPGTRTSAAERLAELERALEAARIGTFEWDLVRSAVHYASDALPIFGTSLSLPRTLSDLLERIHPADREPLTLAAAEVLASPQSSFLQLEFRVDGDDGQVRWLRSQGRILRDARGNAERVFGTVMDVSDRKALETQLIQSQKMEGVGRLAGGVAHDFNNLLTAIFGELELARGEVEPDSEVAASLEAIEQAAERARKLTAQLLAFARQQVFELQESDVSSVVVGLSDLLRRVLGEDVRLELSAAPGLWRTRIDVHQIEQVLLNLAVNAREAMPHGGTLTIETSNRGDGDCPMSGDHVLVTVRDDGAGMSESIRQRAFEPFFTTKELGTGLGLSTCYGIVEQLGGHLAIASLPGEGTEVRVYLPRCEEAPEVPARLGRRGPPGDVVLVVEDEPAVRTMTARGLRKHGYSVIEATHGAEALARLRDPDLRVDVLVSDVVMPEMSGRELAERAAALSPRTRVLFVSGHAEPVIERHGLRRAEGHFLQKPYTPALLARRVRELLDEPGPVGEDI